MTDLFISTRIRQQVAYLVGPITGCAYGGCTDWRDAVKKELEATGIYHCLTPMRGKKHLEKSKDISPLGNESVPGSTSRDILRRDNYDCTRADVLFVNLIGATIISIGSMFEIAWAYDHKRYVVLCMEEGNIHEHIFPREACSIRFPTLGDGVKYMKEVLNA